VLGPHKFLAQVLYPARGYIPREHYTLGQLITPLVPGGPRVPEELLLNKTLETDNQVIGSPWNYCNFTHREYSVSAEDHRTFSQTSTPYSAPGISTQSNILVNNKRSDGALHATQYWNQRPQFISCEESNSTEFLSNKMPKVNTPSELVHVTSNKASIPDTRHQVSGRRYTCNLFYPTLATHESKIVRSGSVCFCSSASSERALRKLPIVSHFMKNDHNFEQSADVKSWYRVHRAQGSNNFSHHTHDGEGRSSHSNAIIDPKDNSDFGWRQCLWSIYHSDDKRVRRTEVKDIEVRKELLKTTRADRITLAEEKPKEKHHLAEFCQYQGLWRYDLDRWITVSALCHSLQVICRKKKLGVKPNGVQPNMFFHSPTVPEILLPAYLKRIAWYLGCPSASFILALEYIHRLAKCCPEVEVNDHSVHQILITCIMVATKFIYDQSIKNSFYARVAGLPGINLAAFEVQLVFLLKFDLYVLPAQYEVRYQSMLEENKGPSMVVIRPEAIATNAD